MSYDNVTHLAAKIKPKQQKVSWFSLLISEVSPIKTHIGHVFPLYIQVELEVAMDTMSPNYCRSKGEQIALNVDGTSSEDSNVYST